MAFDQPAVPVTGEYPVQLNITTERELNRWWGIPFFGVMVRGVAAIPHWVVLQVLGIAMLGWFLFGWIYILAYGRVPALAVKLIIEYLHRSNRVAGYFLLMPGGYPALEPGIPGPSNLTIALDGLEINRWWGVPFFGWFGRVLITLPQLILLSFMIVAVAMSFLVVWIPILVNGRYPDWAANFYGSVMKWGSQEAAYLMLLPVPYPPIWLN